MSRRAVRGTIAAGWPPPVFSFPAQPFRIRGRAATRSDLVVQPRLSSRRNERGQALVEYAMIVAVLGACIVAILGLVRKETERAYEHTASAVSHGTKGYPAGGGVILTGMSASSRPVSRGPTKPPADSASSGG